MSKTYRPYEPDQAFLLPPALTEWLPAGHLVYFLRDVVGDLDLSEITSVYERESRGYPPYHPQMMVSVLLYGYCLGVTSSRRLARRLQEDVAFRVLAANNTPDFRTIADFRKRHLDALGGLFVQVLRLCHKAGLVKLGHVALDGTKLKANASKHKAMSYARMSEEEARLRKEVEALLRRAEEIDAREDAEYGPDHRGDELPEELAFREGRLRKIREAKAGHMPTRVSMDAGYFSEETIEAVEALGTEVFMPPDRRKHGQPLLPAPRGRIPKGLSVADRMRRKLRTRRGRAIYGRRKETVEPVFGQIKQARGFREFLLRGLTKVEAEWVLICTGHNLLKLWRVNPA